MYPYSWPALSSGLRVLQALGVLARSISQTTKLHVASCDTRVSVVQITFKRPMGSLSPSLTRLIRVSINGVAYLIHFSAPSASPETDPCSLERCATCDEKDHRVP